MSLLKKLIPVLLLGLSACNFGTTREPKTIFRPLFGGAFDLRVSNPIQSIRNIPADMRFVQVHRDDLHYTGEHKNGVIEPNNVDAPEIIELSLYKLGLETHIAKGLRLDMYGETPFNFSTLAGVGEVQARNYTNYPGMNVRGYGAALTYYTGIVDPLVIPQGHADLTIGLSKNVEFVLGTGVKYYQLKVETGWDRYNEYEEDRAFRVGRYVDGIATIGLNIILDKGAISKKEDGMNFSAIKFNLGLGKHFIADESERVTIESNEPYVYGSIGLEGRF